jgi:hypothetical protein
MGMDGGVFVIEVEAAKKKWAECIFALIEDHETPCYKKHSKHDFHSYEATLTELMELYFDASEMSDEDFLKALEPIKNCGTPAIFGGVFILSWGDNASAIQEELGHLLEAKKIETWT